MRFVAPCVILSLPKADEESSEFNLLALDPCLRQAGFIRLGEFRMTKRIFHHSHLLYLLVLAVLF